MNLSKQLEVLGNQIKELSSSSGLDNNSVVSLKKKVWELESSVAEQSQQLVEQANSIQHLEQVILLYIFGSSNVLFTPEKYKKMFSRSSSRFHTRFPFYSLGPFTWE